MHICAFGIRVTIVLRYEFLSWKVLRDAKSMGTVALYYPDQPRASLPTRENLSFHKANMFYHSVFYIPKMSRDLRMRRRTLC